MKFKVFTITIVFSLIFNSVKGQFTSIDSLQKLYNNSSSDTEKVILQLGIANLEFNSGGDKGIESWSKAYKLAKKIKYSDGIYYSKAELGNYYQATQQYEKAQLVLDSVIQNFNNINLPEIKIRACIYKALTVNYLTQYDLAIHYIDTGLIINNKRDLELEGILKFTKGQLAYTKFNFLPALQYFNESIIYFEKVYDKNYFILANSAVASIYIYFNQYAKSKEYFEIANSFINSSTSLIAIAVYKTYYSMYLRKTGQYFEAMDILEETLDTYIQLDDKNNVALIYHYIGDCYLEQQDFQNGLKYLWISYDQAVANGTTVNLVMFKNSLSVAYYYKGDYRESEKLIFEGLSQLTSPLDIYLKIPFYIRLSMIKVKEMKCDSAFFYIDKLKPMIQAVNRADLNYYNNFVLASAYLCKGELQNAKIYGEKVYDYIFKSNYIYEKIKIADLLYRISYEAQDFKSALTYKNINKNLNDSLMSLKNNRALNELVIKYDVTKKDKLLLESDLKRISLEKNERISFLNLANEQSKNRIFTLLNDSLTSATILKTKEIEAERENVQEAEVALKLQKDFAAQQEKNSRLGYIILYITIIFLICGSFLIYKLIKQRNAIKTEKLESKVYKSQLNPHFIFNSLTAIKQFIEKSPDDSKHYLTSFAELMREVLENSEKEFISLTEELAMINKYVNLERIRFAGNFNFIINNVNISDTDTIMVPPLILQPIVENAIIHGINGIAKVGKLNIHLELQNNMLDIKVIDNGKGIVQKHNQQIHNGTSFGIRLTKLRIQKIRKKKGYFSIESGELGTSVNLRIPYILNT